MRPSEVLRSLAKEARLMADRHDADRREKAANVVRAAAGLAALGLRLGRGAR